MTSYYTAYDPKDNLYFHFDPHRKIYFASREEVGAILFTTKRAADNFINDANIRPQFFAKEIVANHVAYTDRKQETEIFDSQKH